MRERDLDSVLREGLDVPVMQAPLHAIRMRARDASRRRRAGRSAGIALVALVALACFGARQHDVRVETLPERMVVATPAPMPAPAPEIS